MPCLAVMQTSPCRVLQTIQYIQPQDHAKLGQAELLVVDEAAAIPLPIVKQMMGPYLVFLCSTVNGYEGTGRSLSLKLIAQLRQQSSTAATNAARAKCAPIELARLRFVPVHRLTLSDLHWPLLLQANLCRDAYRLRCFETEVFVVELDLLECRADKPANAHSDATSSGRTLREVSLDEPIRYGPGDAVEKWLMELLCLNAAEHAPRVPPILPHPEDCELFYVERDALFSGHRVTEVALQQMMALYVASHYKNTPNDLLLLSDAPAHHLFVLTAPVPDKTKVCGRALYMALAAVQSKAQ